MTLDRRGTYVDKDGIRRPIPVTVVTQADLDAIAAHAKKLTIDPKDYLAGEFDRWPLDPHVHERHSIIIEEGK